MKAGIQHHRLGFEIAQQYHQHVTLAPMTEAFSDRQFLIVQREKEAVHHPEAHLPPVKYVIALSVDQIVDLTPAHIKRKEP